ncbi:MAG: HD domain-containing phosphohydrolase [Pseudomonadota bacterium]
MEEKGLTAVFEDLVRELARARSHHAIGAGLCQALSPVVQAQACALYLLDPEDGVLVLAHGAGLARGAQPPLRLLGAVMEEQEPWMVPPHALDDAEAAALGTPWARALVLQPVRSLGLPVGVILLATDHATPFDPRTLGMVVYASTVAGLAWERLRQERELLRRNSILSALARISSLAQLESDWAAGVDEVLERLGTATAASRCYLFERHRGAGGCVLVSQRFEWIAAGIGAQLDNPDLQGFDLDAGGFARWRERLDAGEHIAGLVAEFPTTEQRVLRPQGIRSILVVPILDGSGWWGFLGFDHCTRDRRWSRAEIDSLRTAAGALGAAIRAARLRERTERQARLIDTSAGALMMADGAGRLLSWSRGAQHMLGWTSAEVLGRDVRQLGLGPRLTAILDGEQLGTPEARGVSFEALVRNKQGEDLNVFCTVATLRDADGWPREHACVMVDVSQLKLAQQRAQRAAAHLRRALDGTVGTLLRLVEHHDAALALHQERTAELALAMATALGWPRGRQQATWLAALLHDLGKVCSRDTAQPADACAAPGGGPAHVALGREVLAPLEVPWPIATIVAQHHERPDGQGFPAGLRGEAIRPEARLIAVANFVEHRSVRHDVPQSTIPRTVLQEIAQGRGTRFHSEAVEACQLAVARDGFFFSKPRRG